ncbi:MAG: histidine phosphatase family protein, partial [Gaiellales bacterium]
MLHTIHLVRHGEVENPDHVVYADLPGFGLSATGSAQAEAAANHLHDKRVQVVL